ncbi:hypothetical protein EJ110_NYTH35604 [Nymphaea thermarum]|nr:hypothetical protein EJ110_NYTH35604 [Nymphaea thermarum]
MAQKSSPNARDRSAITGGHLEGEGLPIEVGVALPVLAPISGHGLPASPRALDGHCMDVPCTSNVGDEYQVERLNGDMARGKPQIKFLTSFSLVPKVDLSQTIKKALVTLGQVKMLKRRIAPSPIIIRQPKVRRAEVRRRDGDGTWKAPSRVVGTPHLVARAAAQAIVEQGRA